MVIEHHIFLIPTTINLKDLQDDLNTKYNDWGWETVSLSQNVDGRRWVVLCRREVKNKTAFQASRSRPI